MTASISSAVDALLITATAVLPGVEIVEGELGTYVASELFIVLEVNGEDAPATSGLPIRYSEAYGITCLVRAYAGDSDMKSRRQRALAMYEAVRDAIVADPSLTGTVLRASPQTYTLRTGVTDQGGSASEVEFVIHCSNQAS